MHERSCFDHSSFAYPVVVLGDTLAFSRDLKKVYYIKDDLPQRMFFTFEDGEVEDNIGANRHDVKFYYDEEYKRPYVRFYWHDPSIPFDSLYEFFWLDFVDGKLEHWKSVWVKGEIDL